MVLITQLLFGLGSIYWTRCSQNVQLIKKARFVSSVSAESLLELDFLALERLMRQASVDEDIYYLQHYHQLAGRNFDAFSQSRESGDRHCPNLQLLHHTVVQSLQQKRRALQ